MDGLVDASKEPFVYCYECLLPFWGSLANIMHHLMQACGDHYWPLAENIKYDKCYPFTMPESLEDHRLLLVSEEDSSVFLLIVGTGEARAGRHPVSVVCVRGNTADADTDTRPMYGCVVSVTTPPGHTAVATDAVRRGHHPPLASPTPPRAPQVLPRPPRRASPDAGRRGSSPSNSATPARPRAR